MNTTFDDMTAEFAWLKSELLAFVDERELNGVMPSLESLRSARRQDLVDGLARHGGRKAVAERLDLGLAIPRKPYGTWQQPGRSTASCWPSLPSTARRARCHRAPSLPPPVEWIWLWPSRAAKV